MANNTFSEKDSLQLIYQMIEDAKGDLKNNSFFYLVWGWAVLAACLLHYGLLQMGVHGANASLVWPILMGGAGIVSYFAARRMNREAGVRSHISRAIMYLWLGVTGALLTLVVAIFMGSLTFTQAYPVFIMIYGLATFTSGGIIRFRALVIGGALCWPIALVATQADFMNQLLLMALAIICSYLVPGYLLKVGSRQ
jgi:hypothetical protein